MAARRRHLLGKLGRGKAEGVHALQGDEGPLAGEGDVAAFAGVRVEHHYALGPVGVVGEAEGVGRACVPDALSHLGMKVVVAEQDEVRLERPEVDLDLVDVGVLGLELLDPGVGDEQVGALGAAGRGWPARGPRASPPRSASEGRRARPGPAPGRDLEALVGEAAGEVDLREGVGQSGVGAAPARQAGRVVVAADDDRRHPVVPDLGQGPLGHTEGAVVRGGVVEDIAEPDHQVGLLGEGEGDGRLERPLEVPFPLVDPALDRVGQVGAAEVGVADGGDLHRDQYTTAQ